MVSLPTFDQSWLSELQRLLLGTETLHQFLDELASLTARELPAGSSCGVAVCQNSQPITLAASDGQAGEMDQLQYSLGEGPCLDALDTGKVRYIADTVTAQRWVRFCRAAGERGVRSCLALPLVTPGGQVGCYNLYSRHMAGFAEQSRGHLEVLAGNAAGAVAVAMRLADQAQLSQDLRDALTSRAVIDRAIGILMAQQRCCADTAFDLLCRASQSRNVKLREVAAEIVRSVGGKDSEEGNFRVRS